MDIKILIAGIISIFFIFIFGSAIIPPIESSRANMIDGNCANTYVNQTYDNEFVMAACTLTSQGDCLWSQNQTRIVANCTSAIQQSATDKIFSHTMVMALIALAVLLAFIGLIWHYKSQGHN